MKDADRAGLVSSQGRVKLHIFEPSGRRIWTVVGARLEYWQNPELDFCSCPGFYFGSLNGQGRCSHLKSIRLARKDGNVEEIRFDDEEFDDFLAGLVSLL